jgi:hypothetical protein
MKFILSKKNDKVTKLKMETKFGYLYVALNLCSYNL